MPKRIFNTCVNVIKKTLADPWQFIRYLVGGFSSFIVDFLSYTLLVQVLHVPAAVTPTVSAFWVIPYAFLVQKCFTFRNKCFTKTQMGRYIILIVENWAISTLGLWLLVDLAGLNPLVGKVIVMCLVVVNNFPLFKFWVFSSR